MTDEKKKTNSEKKPNPYSVIADNSFSERPTSRQELVDRIANDPRMHDHKDGFESCIQCGVCTSGCPAARFTEYSPRETARRALDGFHCYRVLAAPCDI